MRLIDADRLEDSWDQVKTMIDNVEAQPTAEAIPVKFIRKYVLYYTDDVKKFDIADAIVDMVDDYEKQADEGIENMTNAEYCMHKGIKFADIQLRNCKRMYGGGYYVARKDTDEKIGHIVPPAVTDSGNKTDAYYAFRIWLDQKHEDYKSPEDILTGEERGYLKQVIAPFREVVSSIKKCSTGIDIYYDSLAHEVFLPLSFEYRGMEEGKFYTLKELGL